MLDAGFDDVDVRSTPIDLHLPPPEEFLWQYVRSTPLAAAVAEIDEERRAAPGTANRPQESGGWTQRLEFSSQPEESS